VPHTAEGTVDQFLLLIGQLYQPVYNGDELIPA
jgi:hypothetical protein